MIVLKRPTNIWKSSQCYYSSWKGKIRLWNIDIYQPEWLNLKALTMPIMKEIGLSYPAGGNESGTTALGKRLVASNKHRCTLWLNKFYPKNIPRERNTYVHHNILNSNVITSFIIAKSWKLFCVSEVQGNNAWCCSHTMEYYTVMKMKTETIIICNKYM